MCDGLQFQLQQFLQVDVEFEYPNHLFELKAEHYRVNFGLIAFLFCKQLVLLQESRQSFAINDASLGQLCAFDNSPPNLAFYDSVIKQIDESVLQLHLMVLFGPYHIDIVDVVYWGIVAKQKIRHKLFLYFSVLPQDIIFKFLHQFSIQTQKGAIFHSFDNQPFALKKIGTIEGDRLIHLPFKSDPLSIQMLQLSLQAEDIVYGRIFVQDISFFLLAKQARQYWQVADVLKKSWKCSNISFSAINIWLQCIQGKMILNRSLKRCSHPGYLLAFRFSLYHFLHCQYSGSPYKYTEFQIMDSSITLQTKKIISSKLCSQVSLVLTMHNSVYIQIEILLLHLFEFFADYIAQYFRIIVDSLQLQLAFKRVDYQWIVFPQLISSYLFVAEGYSACLPPHSLSGRCSFRRFTQLATVSHQVADRSLRA